MQAWSGDASKADDIGRHHCCSWQNRVPWQFLLKACDLCQLQEFYVSVSDDARMIAALKDQLPELEKIVKQM